MFQRGGSQITLLEKGDPNAAMQKSDLSPDVSAEMWNYSFLLQISVLKLFDL